MQPNHHLLNSVEKIYNWIDSQNQKARLACNACGRCCDFETYGHQLFVTMPELMYFAEKLGPENIRPMKNSACPYSNDGKCIIHPNRFAACRIFFCKGDTPAQNQLSEQVVNKFRILCNEFDIPYRYTDLKNALNTTLFTAP